MLVPAETPELKVELCDHCTVYGVAASPEPPSVEAVQVQVGTALLVGVVVVVDVPGVDGLVASTLKAIDPLLAVVYALAAALLSTVLTRQ